MVQRRDSNLLIVSVAFGIVATVLGKSTISVDLKKAQV